MTTMQDKLKTWYDRMSQPSRQGGLDNPGHIIKFQSEIPREVIKSSYVFEKGAWITTWTNEWQKGLQNINVPM